MLAETESTPNWVRLVAGIELEDATPESLRSGYRDFAGRLIEHYLTNGTAEWLMLYVYDFVRATSLLIDAAFSDPEDGRCRAAAALLDHPQTASELLFPFHNVLLQRQSTDEANRLSFSIVSLFDERSTSWKVNLPAGTLKAFQQFHLAPAIEHYCQNHLCDKEWSNQSEFERFISGFGDFCIREGFDSKLTKLAKEVQQVLQTSGSWGRGEAATGKIGNFYLWSRLLGSQTRFMYHLVPPSSKRTPPAILLALGAREPLELHTLEKIFELLGLASGPVARVLAVREKNVAQREALRSAVSMILCRVNAHDMGHVLSHATPPEEDSHFNQLMAYLRTRMVFAAEASASDPTWSGTLAFVSQIITRFRTADPADTTHPLSAVCRFLARSENVNEISVIPQLGDDPLELRQEGRHQTVYPREIMLSIPTGLVGVHALYCILENVIRNGAKYGGHRLSQMSLHIRLDEGGVDDSWASDFVRVRVWENHSRFNKPVFHAICQFLPPNASSELHEGYPAGSEPWRLVDTMGKPVAGGFGMKEMRICAAWLRGFRLSHALMREDRLELPLIKPLRLTPEGRSVAVSRTDDAEETYLGYELFLRKPKHVYCCSAEFADLADDVRQAMAVRGLEIEDALPDSVPQAKSHSMAIIAPNTNESPESFARRLRANREQLPSILLVPAEGEFRQRLSRIKDIGCISFELYRDLAGSMIGLLKDPKPFILAYAQWLRTVLALPERMRLVLHLGADSRSAPLEVANIWAEGATLVKSLNLGWDVVVVRESKYQVVDDDVVHATYDVHSENVKALRHPEAGWFYEALHGMNADRIVLLNPPVNRAVGQGWYAAGVSLYLLAASVQVAIVDERICNRIRGKKEVREVFDSVRIFLPDTNLAGYEDREDEFLNKLVDDLRNKGVRLASIHQGMLDKLLCDQGKIDKWIQKLEEHVPYVVVHSDRGRNLLPRLPDRVRFVQYSAIENWIAPGEVAKYNLVQTLLAARRKGEDNADTDYHFE